LRTGVSIDGFGDEMGDFRRLKGVGKIEKSIDELNRMFGTKFKHPSKIKEGINRGLREIEKIAGVFMTAFYDRFKKKFVISWEQFEPHPKLRIPFGRIDELIDWYIEHANPKIRNLSKYKKHLKQKILEDEFEHLDEYYGGMMSQKYGADTVKLYNPKTGRWKDISRKRKITI